MTELLPVGSRTLEEIADGIRLSQARMEKAACALISAAIEIGDALLEAEKMIPAGQFGAWCEENVAISIGNRNNFMRLAYFKDSLPSEILNPPAATSNGRLTVLKREPAAIGPALRYIRTLGLRRPHPFKQPRARDDVDEMRRLRNSGLTDREIGELLGVHKSTVRRALMPQRQRQELVLRKNRDAKRRAAFARREEQRQAMSKATPDLKEAYALVRRCLYHTQAAHDLYKKGNARKTIVSALGYLHKAEDALAESGKLADIEDVV